jgi:flagellar basal body-associated protein FliL
MATIVVIGVYIVQIIVVLVCILLGYFIYDKRFKRNHGTEVAKDFEPTDEVNLDPVTGEKTRVYYNSKTGERFYKKEK